MLDLTAEFVTQAASNSLVVFCFCNLLIVIIAMAPKPGSNFDERSEFHLPILTYSSRMNERRVYIEQPPEDKEMMPEVMELCGCENIEKEAGSHGSKEEESNEDNSNINNILIPNKLGSVDYIDKNNSESNNEDDDEFRRRIEAFIDKINREWKAEKLRTQYGCEEVDL